MGGRETLAIRGQRPVPHEGSQSKDTSEVEIQDPGTSQIPLRVHWNPGLRPCEVPWAGQHPQQGWSLA